MDNQTGMAFKTAVVRAKEHEAFAVVAGRRLTVRLSTRWADDLGDGLFINARFAAKTNEELKAQQDKGDRFVAWEALDGADLVALVDEAVAEVEMAVRDAPVPVPCPWRSEAEAEFELYNALHVATYKAITEASTKVKSAAEFEHIPSREACDATMAAAMDLAALASFAGEIGPDEIQSEFKRALSLVRRKAGLGWPKLPYGGLIG